MKRTFKAMGLVALVMAMALLMAVPAFVFAQQAVGQSSDNTLTITVKGVSFKMIRVQGGTFTMGCTTSACVWFSSLSLPSGML